MIIAILLVLILIAVLLCSRIGRSILVLSIVSTVVIVGGTWLFFGS